MNALIQRWLWLWIPIVCVSVFPIIGWIWWHYGHYPHTVIEGLDLTLIQKAGGYGDSWGFINSAFSAFGVCGVLVAIILQGVQLRQQQKEMSEARADSLLAAFLEAMSVQLTTLESQKGELQKLIESDEQNADAFGPELAAIHGRIRSNQADLGLLLSSIRPSVSRYAKAKFDVRVAVLKEVRWAIKKSRDSITDAILPGEEHCQTFWHQQLIDLRWTIMEYQQSEIISEEGLFSLAGIKATVDILIKELLKEQSRRLSSEALSKWHDKIISRLDGLIIEIDNIPKGYVFTPS